MPSRGLFELLLIGVLLLTFVGVPVYLLVLLVRYLKARTAPAEAQARQAVEAGQTRNP